MRTATTSRVSAGEILEINRMSQTERDTLSKRLYPVHCRIFSGTSETAFRLNVQEPSAERTILRLYFAPKGEIVGYCALHRFRRHAFGRRIILLRTEAGTRPEYRHLSATPWFTMRGLVVERLMYPWSKMVLLGNLVHPSGYHVLCTYFPRVFPHVDRKDDLTFRALALELADSFPDAPVSPDDPFVRKSHGITIENTDGPVGGVQEAHQVSQLAKYFEQRNPCFSKGHGLVVMVPLTLDNMRWAFCVSYSTGSRTRCVCSGVTAEPRVRSQPMTHDDAARHHASPSWRSARWHRAKRRVAIREVAATGAVVQGARWASEIRRREAATTSRAMRTTPNKVTVTPSMTQIQSTIMQKERRGRSIRAGAAKHRLQLAVMAVRLLCHADLPN